MIDTTTSMRRVDMVAAKRKNRRRQPAPKEQKLFNRSKPKCPFARQVNSFQRLPRQPGPWNTDGPTATQRKKVPPA